MSLRKNPVMDQAYKKKAEDKFSHKYGFTDQTDQKLQKRLYLHNTKSAGRILQSGLSHLRWGMIVCVCSVTIRRKKAGRTC